MTHGYIATEDERAYVQEFKDRLTKQEEQDADTSMKVLAALNGDAKTASVYLNEHEGIDTSPAKLMAMRKGKDFATYERYAEEFAPRLEGLLVREMREVAAQSLALERKLMEKLDKQLIDNTLQDPARALQAVSKVKQTSVDKLLSLTGRPTSITEHRSASEIVKKLEAMKVLIPLGEGSDDE